MTYHHWMRLIWYDMIWYDYDVSDFLLRYDMIRYRYTNMFIDWFIIHIDQVMQWQNLLQFFESLWQAQPHMFKVNVEWDETSQACRLRRGLIEVDGTMPAMVPCRWKKTTDTEDNRCTVVDRHIESPEAKTKYWVGMEPIPIGLITPLISTVSMCILFYSILV